MLPDGQRHHGLADVGARIDIGPGGFERDPFALDFAMHGPFAQDDQIRRRQGSALALAPSGPCPRSSLTSGPVQLDRLIETMWFCGDDEA